MILREILAGVFISLGGMVYLNNPNIVGAILFSIGILAVIGLQCPLYTGQVGFVTKDDIPQTIESLIGNLFGAVWMGVFYHMVASDEVIQTANDIIFKKMHQGWFTQIFMGMICGMCIYICVRFAKEYNKNIFTIIPIVVFIMVGGNHCIADAFYYSVSGYSDNIIFTYLFRVILGNSIGSILIHRTLQFSNKNT